MANKIIWRLPAVIACTGVSRSGIYQKIADGQFPKSIRLGRRAVGWDSDEIQQWIQDRIDESRREGQVA